MGYYKLSYSGQEVDTAVERILSLDPNLDNTSHIIDIDSTEAVPFDPANLTQIGLYRVMHLDPTKVPPELAQMHPVYITVCVVKDPSSGDESLAQMITCVNCKVYVRISEDGGQSFSEWDYPKEIDADEINAMFENNGVDPSGKASMATASVNAKNASTLSSTATGQATTAKRKASYAT